MEIKEQFENSDGLTQPQVIDVTPAWRVHILITFWCTIQWEEVYYCTTPSVVYFQASFIISDRNRMALKNTSSPQCLSPLSKSTEFPFNLSELAEISSYSVWIVLFPKWSQGLRCDVYQSCIPLWWLAAILFYVCSTSVHHWIVPDVGVPACCSYPRDCCCEHQDTQIYSNLVFSLQGTTRNGATRAHGCFALDFNWPCQITFCSSGPSHGYSDFSESLSSRFMVPFNK